MEKKCTLSFVGILLLCYQLGIAQNSSPFWSTQGNSNVTLSHKFGTTNNISLRFFTNNLERMKILSTGNVGIGTSSPSQKLHVAGNTLITGNLGIGAAASAYKLDVTGTGHFSSGLVVSEGIQVGTNAGLTAVYGYGGSYGVEGYGSYAGTYGSGTNYGAYGYSYGGIGVYGGSSSSYGVYGTSEKAASVYGVSLAQTGVLGSSTNQVGVYGSSVNYHGGLFVSTKGYGMWAKTGATGAGSYAGVFEGNVYTYGVYSTSDQTLKKNIEKLDNAMDILDKLNPTYYEFKDDGKYAGLHLPKGKHYGLLAQEVEKVLPEIVDASLHELGEDPQLPAFQAPTPTDGKTVPPSTNLPAVFAPEKRERVSLKAVNYTELIPIMIKAIQEQQVTIKEQQASIEDLTAQVKILAVKAGLTKVSAAFMEQNIPNPVTTSTTIRYSLPLSTRTAKITLTNIKGQLLKTFSLNNSGDGQLRINRGALAAGMYQYTLYADGERIDSKTMILP